ncbi:hypothetical protein [Luteimonas sp. FCS-9]|uniref:hypothetical protein n=1 Tax=Luteimonas sp. FCS-9 TaxID=1547516 RepID=UPI00063EC52A|nr:hypothetical protein [Luteimonas sp. FCS-9]KLJ02419.1 hypothetical protein WQ56_02450 [Luteimonas sp. FCS-9]
MEPHRTTSRAPRTLRWGIAAGAVVLALGAYWVALDHVATRIGQDAESSLRSAPLNDDTRHRAD